MANIYYGKIYRKKRGKEFIKNRSAVVSTIALFMKNDNKNNLTKM